MRAPYVALSWRGAAGEAAVGRLAPGLADAGWRRAWDAPGLGVWIRPERPALLSALPRGEGVLIGHRLGDVERSGADGPATLAAAGRRLCASGWGAYLALLCDPASGRWSVFRDPSGAVEAYTWRQGQIDVLCSGLVGVPRGLLPPGLGLDWEAITDLLGDSSVHTWRSPLGDVSVVCPGDLHPLGGGAADAEPIWRPGRHLPPRRCQPPDPAWPGRLRETVATVVSGLARPYRRLTSEVSGGLDSAIVNAALAEAGLSTRVAQALHYVGDRREGDERAWAAEVCAHFGLPFVAVDLAGPGLDPAVDFAELCRDLRPPFAALDPGRDRDTARRLRASASDAIVTGEGGDAVFYQMPSPKMLADLWSARPLSAVLHRQNTDLARRLRRSVWSIWRDAARPPRPRVALGVLAGPRLRGARPGPRHPWLADLADAPPGKRLQVEALVGAGISAGPSRISAASDLLQPLLAQPVMELALSIPSWELARGQGDRGLAREAFAAWLPRSVIARRAKGALTSFYARQAAASVDVLRPYLMDGVLAEAGLLDRDAVAAALDPDDLIRRADGLALISATALEAWVRGWQTEVPDLPSASRDRPTAAEG